jgi:hypothetical protein
LSQTRNGIGKPKNSDDKSKCKFGLRGVWEGVKGCLHNIFAPFARITDVGLFTAVLAVVAFLQWQTFEKTDDTLWANQRPWLKAEVSVASVQMTEWGGHKGVFINLKFLLQNYGHSPATNLRISPVIVEHPGNTRRHELDLPQELACKDAATQADKSPIEGDVIFPGDVTGIERNQGLPSIYDTKDRVLFSIYGCIDYSYGDHRHGQTGYRILLGQDVGGQIFGVPFKEGVPQKDYVPPPDLLANGFPAQAPKIAKLSPSEFIFRPDPEGNYAK